MSTEARRAPFPSFPPRPKEPPPARTGTGEPPAETPTETTTRLRPVVESPAPATSAVPAPAASAVSAASSASQESAASSAASPESPEPPGTSAGSPAGTSAPRSGVPPRPTTAPPAYPPRPPAPPATRRRPVGAVDLTQRPGAGGPAIRTQPHPVADETPVETTTRLRPVPARHPARAAAAAACVVLGLGLLGGAAAGSMLSGDSAAAGPSDGFTASRGLWHSTPVDTLFPRRSRASARAPAVPTAPGPGWVSRRTARARAGSTPCCCGRSSRWAAPGWCARRTPTPPAAA